jgi:hypothetical protein
VRCAFAKLYLSLWGLLDVVDLLVRAEAMAALGAAGDRSAVVHPVGRAAASGAEHS